MNTWISCNKALPMNDGYYDVKIFYHIPKQEIEARALFYSTKNALISSNPIWINIPFNYFIHTITYWR